MRLDEARKRFESGATKAGPPEPEPFDGSTANPAGVDPGPWKDLADRTDSLLGELRTRRIRGSEDLRPLETIAVDLRALANGIDPIDDIIPQGPRDLVIATLREASLKVHTADGQTTLTLYHGTLDAAIVKTGEALSYLRCIETGQLEAFAPSEASDEFVRQYEEPDSPTVESATEILVEREVWKALRRGSKVAVSGVGREPVRLSTEKAIKVRPHGGDESDTIEAFVERYENRDKGPGRVEYRIALVPASPPGVSGASGRIVWDEAESILDPEPARPSGPLSWVECRRMVSDLRKAVPYASGTVAFAKLSKAIKMVQMAVESIGSDGSVAHREIVGTLETAAKFTRDVGRETHVPRDAIAKLDLYLSKVERLLLSFSTSEALPRARPIFTGEDLAARDEKIRREVRGSLLLSDDPE